MAEIPLGEVITAGKFLVNQHPMVVLFNSEQSKAGESQCSLGLC
jgi:hypothetical protein